MTLLIVLCTISAFILGVASFIAFLIEILCLGLRALVCFSIGPKMKKREGYTKQGVRDLNSLPAPKRKGIAIPPDCDHTKMRIHCRNEKGKPCGHLICGGCGLFWDPSDGAW